MVKKKWPAGKNTRQRVMTCHWLAVISTEGKAHSPCVLSIFICNIKRLYCYQGFSNFLILFVSEFFCIEVLYGIWIYKQKTCFDQKSEDCDEEGSNSLLPSPPPSTSPTHLWNTSTEYSVKTFHLESNSMWWSRVCALESSICGFQYGLHQTT